MDLAYIENNFLYSGGFVRTIVMRFFKGFVELNPRWADLVVLAQNMTNNTNITSLDNYPDGILPGEPIITLLQPDFEEGQRGISETTYFSTMVEVEVQFYETVNNFLEDLTKEYIFQDEWISETLWIFEECFAGAFPRCKFESKFCIYENFTQNSSNRVVCFHLCSISRENFTFLKIDRNQFYRNGPKPNFC